MGHYAYLFVAGFVIAFSVLAVGMRGDARIADTETAKIQYKEEARDAAHAGLTLTLRRLVSDEGDWTGASVYGMDSTAYRLASFNTTVTPITPDTVDITSVGRKWHVNRRSEYVDTTHIIDVRIIRAPLAGGPPPAFYKAIVTNDNLTIGGSTEIRSFAEGGNANVHTNATLDNAGNDFLVEGFGTFTGSETVDQPDNFQPPDDENGEEEANVLYHDLIPIPEIDMEMLRYHAKDGGRGVHFDSDLSIDGASVPYRSFGEWALAVGLDEEIGTSPDFPFIVFSEGTIEFAAGSIIRLDGYGAFVSANDMHINRNSVIQGEIGIGEDGSAYTQMMLFVDGNFMINGRTILTASVLTSGEYTLGAGTVRMSGGIMANSIGFQSGNLLLTWAGPNEGFAQYAGGTTEILGPVIASWAEW